MNKFIILIEIYLIEFILVLNVIFTNFLVSVDDLTRV